MISLRGGLGNQLFQLAYGLSLLSEKNKDFLLLENKIGSPKYSKNGNPELLELKIPNNVKIINSNQTPFLLMKIMNFFIRQSVTARNYDFNKRFKLLRILSAKLLSRLFEQKSDLLVQNGVGFDENWHDTLNILYCVGYFQSYKWSELANVKKSLLALSLNTESNWVGEMKSLAKIEKPLVVQVRLGDYLSEKKFGIPSMKYFDNAISYYWKTGNFKKIWIFTNDSNLVMNYLPHWVQEFSRIVFSPDSSSAENLEVMRYGKAFVISNSTFGWWGAYLNYDNCTNITCPEPWFKDQCEPRELIPPNWRRILGWERL